MLVCVHHKHACTSTGTLPPTEATCTPLTVYPCSHKFPRHYTCLPTLECTLIHVYTQSINMIYICTYVYTTYVHLYYLHTLRPQV